MTTYNEDNQGDILMRNIVVRLKEEMQKQEVGLNQLSRDSGVSNATISRIFNYKTYPNFGTVYKLFLTLGIELEVAGWTLDGGIRKF